MTTPEKKPSWKQYIFVFLAVLIGVAISQFLRGCSTGLPSSVRPYVNEADKRSYEAVDESLEEINAFFAQAKKNARPFADAAIGWESKLWLMVDYVLPSNADSVLPLRNDVFIFPTIGPAKRIGDTRHGKYIKAKFNEMIFSDEQLAKAVEDAVAGFFQRLESIDSKMLVDIRADLPNLAEGSALQIQEERLLLETYRETIEKVRKLSTNKNIGEIGAAVASEVLVAVAVRLAVSLGILAAGAASSYFTLGVGIIVAIIVDYLVTKIWDWYADPKGTLAAEIVGGLDHIQTLLIDGAPATDSADAVIGLRSRLTEYARQRQEHREATLRELLKP